jgi:NADP-dependent 3-hydroxy acid dehydrogenase YdfG
MSGAPLSGRVAVVVGASGGIGRAVCRALVDAGANVMMVDRDADRLAELQLELDAGGLLSWAAAEPTSPLEVDDAREAALARFGHVDLLVVSTGVVTGSAFEDGVPADWAEMIDVNLRGLLHAAQAFADPLLDAAREGRAADMVFVGAVGAHAQSPRFAVFNAVSAAVKQLSRTLRQEYGPRGVRVHTVELGFLATEFGRRHPQTRAGSDEDFPRVSRTVRPEAVAALVTTAVAMPADVNLTELVATPTEMG